MVDRIIRAPSPDRIIRAPGRATVVVRSSKTRIISDGRGMPGPPGPAGGETFQVNAVRALSGHRALILTEDGADYPAGDEPLDAEAIVGVSVTAAAPHAPITIRRIGVIEEGSWSWSEGPVFASDLGVLTQSPSPSAAWLRQVGTAVAPTRMIVDLRPVIRL